jgi:hypothetical protein
MRTHIEAHCRFKAELEGIAHRERPERLRLLNARGGRGRGGRGGLGGGN